MIEQTFKNGVKKINEATIKDGRSLVINNLNLDIDNIPVGTILVDNISFDIRIKKDNGMFEKPTANNVFDTHSINGIFLEYETIDNTNLKTNCIDNRNIKDNTIVGEKLLDGSIEHYKLSLDIQSKLDRIPSDIYTSEGNTVLMRKKDGVLLEPGDIVSIDEQGYVNKSYAIPTRPILGVVSKYYKDSNKVNVVFSGECLVKANGFIDAGSNLVVSSLGYAIKENNNRNPFLGMALETNNSTSSYLMRCILKL